MLQTGRKDRDIAYRAEQDALKSENPLRAQISLGSDCEAGRLPIVGHFAYELDLSAVHSTRFGSR